MDSGKKLPCYFGEIKRVMRAMLLVPVRIETPRPFVAEMGNEIGDDRHVIFATLPGEADSPIRSRGSLHPTTIKIAPGHPVSMGRSCEIRAVRFKAGKLLIVIAMNIEDWHGAD